VRLIVSMMELFLEEYFARITRAGLRRTLLEGL
jgi:hypothetical protein